MSAKNEFIDKAVLKGEYHTQLEDIKTQNISDTIFALITSIDTKNTVNLFIEAKTSFVSDILANGGAYDENYYLFDEVIRAMNPTINMDLVLETPALGNFCMREEDAGDHYLRDRKEEVIALLTLQREITRKVNQLVTEMAKISIKKETGACQYEEQ